MNSVSQKSLITFFCFLKISELKDNCHQPVMGPWQFFGELTQNVF